MSDPLRPSAGVLCKIGSVVVHADEMLSAKGHAFDAEALKSLLRDPELVEWLKAMDKLALIPKKR